MGNANLSSFPKFPNFQIYISQYGTSQGALKDELHIGVTTTTACQRSESFFLKCLFTFTNRWFMRSGIRRGRIFFSIVPVFRSTPQRDPSKGLERLEPINDTLFLVSVSSHRHRSTNKRSQQLFSHINGFETSTLRVQVPCFRSRV